MRENEKGGMMKSMAGEAVRRKDIQGTAGVVRKGAHAPLGGVSWASCMYKHISASSSVVQVPVEVRGRVQYTEVSTGTTYSGLSQHQCRSQYGIGSMASTDARPVLVVAPKKLQ